MAILGSSTLAHCSSADSDDAVVDNPRGATGTSCDGDADCSSAFCDVGVCSTPTPEAQSGGRDYWYGRACQSSELIVGPYGTGDWGGAGTCSPGYICSEGHCRSCSSAAECYDVMGLFSCVETASRPGKQCVDAAVPGSETYVPPDKLPRVGRPSDPVAREPGMPESVRLSLTTVPEPGSRLAVVWWHQRAGEPDELMHLAYDVELLPSASTVEIPFASLVLPNQEDIICYRGCRDRTLCACEGLPKVALGSVVVAIDMNGDGRLSLEEARREQVGAAPVIVAWSPEHQAELPRGSFSGVFGAGIPRGFAAFGADADGLLVAVTDVTVAAELSLCPTGSGGCQLPVTHLFCHHDCDRDWGLDRFGM